MYTPSVKLIAWTQLRRADDDALAQTAADVLESAALDEIKWAWVRGDLSPMRSLSIRIERDPMSELQSRIEGLRESKVAEASWGEPVTQEQVDQMLVERDLQKASQEASPIATESAPQETEEVGQAPELGEIPQVFEGPRKLVNSQALSKAFKKYAEMRGLTLDALSKEMGWAKGSANLRSILNKKGSVDTKYADFFVSLFGQSILSD